jgi:hypothetical protein
MSFKHLYGEFSENQIAQTKKSLRGSIFFLLLCVDPKTSWEYQDVDVNQCFNGLLLKIGGLNELLLKQPEIVTTMSLLQAALMEFNNPDFNFSVYRKLILDAGSEINKLREED